MVSRYALTVAIYVAAILAGWLSCASLEAQDQRFRIRVPGEVSINASNHFAQISHDETDADQVFGWQYWQVVCNNAKGAVLTFETNQAFTHATNPAIKRDAALLLEKVDGKKAKKWSVKTPADQTDYAAGDEVAVVMADTKKAANGEFRLQVTFLEELFVNTPAGDYDLTITGTIVPK